jgi:DNA-binding protein HU-beta
MNKTELIDAIAIESGLSKTDSKKALNGFLTAVHNELKKGGRISLVGHGSYTVVDRGARSGINPKTQEVITIPAKKVIKFKPGTDLTL